MSNICLDCINDEYWKSIYLPEVKFGECDYCKSHDTKCITIESLSVLLEPLIFFYSPIEEFMYIEEMKRLDGDGRYIWEAIQEDWELFPELEYETLEDLFTEMFLKDKDDPGLLLSSFVEDEYQYYGVDRETTEQLEEKWQFFCEEIKYKNRFFLEGNLDTELLTDLFIYLKTVIAKDSKLYRARLNNTGTDFTCGEMGKPPREISTAGRANPQGIPYLYVASSIQTAISEVRPTIRNSVTVAEFTIEEALSIVDLRNPRIDSPFRFGHDLRHFSMHLGFLRILGIEISKPLNPGITELEYIPLQYLCELIKNKGFDGVAYASSVSDGDNLAIFTDNKLKCNHTEQYLITDINFNKIEKMIF